MRTEEMCSTSAAVAILILCHVHQASAQPRIQFIVPPLMIFVFITMATIMFTISCCLVWRKKRAQRAAGVPTSPIFPTSRGANFATVKQTSPVILSAPGETTGVSAYPSYQPQQPSGSDYQRPFQEPREVKKGDATLADFTF